MIKRIYESCLQTAHKKKSQLTVENHSKENILQGLESLFESLDRLSCVSKEIADIDILKTSRPRNSDRKITQPIRIGSGCQRMRKWNHFSSQFR